jgi:sugar phosphate isomerase/epimerase
VFPIQQNLFINAPYALVRSRLERLLSLQVGVEVYFDADAIREITSTDVRKLARELDDRSIARTVHAPFVDLNPGAVDKDVWKITLDKLKKAIEFANVLGAKTIVCHGNYDKWRYDSREDLWLDRSVLTWTELLKDAGDLPVLIENIFDRDPSALVSLMDHFSERNLWICFDMGHFNLFSTLPLDGWLIPLKNKIREFHIHDNYGKKDDHLPIGQGTVPFRELKPFLRSLPGVLFTAETHSEDAAGDTIRCAKEFLS